MEDSLRCISVVNFDITEMANRKVWRFIHLWLRDWAQVGDKMDPMNKNTNCDFRREVGIEVNAEKMLYVTAGQNHDIKVTNR
jgi:hypothetical protein